jgi:hypothetical protein
MGKRRISGQPFEQPLPQQPSQPVSRALSVGKHTRPWLFFLVLPLYYFMTAHASAGDSEEEVAISVLDGNGELVEDAFLYSDDGSLVKRDGLFFFYPEKRADGTKPISVNVFSPDLGASQILRIFPNKYGALPQEKALKLSGNDGCNPSWVPTFSGGNGPNGLVYSLEVFDDGSGPALFVGGNFSEVAGVSANNIAKWDGEKWSSLSSGLNSVVRALEVHDDGTGAGEKLYATGLFTQSGDNGMSHIASWDGAEWSALGAGLNDAGLALISHAQAPNSQPLLFVGGTFSSAGGDTANLIASWDGSAWNPVSTALGNGVTRGNGVNSFESLESSAETNLYVGGSFVEVGGIDAGNVARWDGQAWWPMGEGLTTSFSNSIVFSLLQVDEGLETPTIFAGGYFFDHDENGKRYLAKWSEGSWKKLDSELEDTVRSLISFDDGSGSGNRVYATGAFEFSDAKRVNYVSYLNDSGWQPLESGLASSSIASTVFDDQLGGGSSIYFGGGFEMAGGEEAAFVARWGCRAVDVQLADMTQTYNGTQLTPSVTTDPPSLLPVTKIYFDGSAVEPIDAGAYSVLADVIEPGWNGWDEGNFIIEPAEALISIEQSTFVYSGDVVSIPVFTVPSPLNTIVSYEGGSPSIDVGTYSVEVSVDDPNGFGSNIFEIQITPAQAFFSTSETTQSYTGEPLEPTITTSPQGLEYTISYDGGAQPPVEVGVYDVYAVIDDSNYEGDLTFQMNVVEPIVSDLKVTQMPLRGVEGAVLEPAFNVQILDQFGKDYLVDSDVQIKAEILDEPITELGGTKTASVNSGLALFPDLAIRSEGTGRQLVFYVVGNADVSVASAELQILSQEIFSDSFFGNK